MKPNITLCRDYECAELYHHSLHILQGVALNYKKGYICVMVLQLSCLGWHGNTIVDMLTISITFALLIEMATQEVLIL